MIGTSVADAARRRTIRLSAVFVAFACMLAVTACTSGSRTDAPGKPGSVVIGDAGETAVYNAAEKPGGTLHAVAGNIDSVDPARSYQQWVWNFMRLYNRTLVTYGVAKDGVAPVVPDLATDTGTPNADYTQWTFTLKPGLAFDDGTPITSAAVKYGVERNFAADVIVGGPTYLVSLLDDPQAQYPGPFEEAPPAPTTPGTPAASAPQLTSVQTPDASTVVFTLRRPFTEFPKILAMPSAAPVPQARDTGAAYGSAPASSGPYKIESINPVSGISLVRNEHWSAETDSVRTALPDKIVVQTGRSVIERDQALLSGAADIDLTGSGVAVRTERRITSSKALADRSSNVLNGRVRMLALPTFVAPFDKPECRQALAGALDREAVIKAAGGPTRATSLSTLYPLELPGAPKTEAPTDPVKPASSVGTLCWPEGSPPLNLAVPNSPAELLVASAVRTALTAAGIASVDKGSDPTTYYSKTIGDKDVVTAAGLAMLPIRWNADYPSVGSFIGRLADSRADRNAGSNFVGLADPAVDAAIDAANAASEPKQADAALVTAVDATTTYIPLMEEKSILLTGERLTNVVINPSYDGYDVALVGVAGGAG